MDLTADIEEPESRSNSQQTSKQEQQSSASSSSSISQSASAPFATYSSTGSSNGQQQQVVPEFGMRNPPKGQSSSASSSSSQQSDHQKAFDNYAAEQAQMTFEPISSAYKQSGHSGVVTREFSPSVYRMSDSRHAVFESANGGNNGGNGGSELMNAHESEQTYGQAATMSNEMDSPYYSKTTDTGSSPFAANGAESGGSGEGGFTPISMSVDEAFRKYFPAQKEQDGGAEQQQQQQQQQYQQSGDVFGQQQQQQSQQAPKTQYITTYASDGAENVQQVCPKNEWKGVIWMNETDGRWRLNIREKWSPLVSILLFYFLN